MKKNKREEKVQQIIEMAKTKGWTLDRWGNLKKEINGEFYRLKFQTLVVRQEIKMNDGGWYRLHSASIAKTNLENHRIAKMLFRTF
ncbi:MAG: hypothetical protein WC143_08325 [Eubacteriales bacterium]|jgi:hypothetical protein